MDHHVMELRDRLDDASGDSPIFKDDFFDGVPEQHLKIIRRLSFMEYEGTVGHPSETLMWKAGSITFLDEEGTQTDQPSEEGEFCLAI
jgi:hypothetical protein